MIEQIAARELWTSPGGQTSHATLCSALTWEINDRGADARFMKTDCEVGETARGTADVDRYLNLFASL